MWAAGTRRRARRICAATATLTPTTPRDVCQLPAMQGSPDQTPHRFIRRASTSFRGLTLHADRLDTAARGYQQLPGGRCAECLGARASALPARLVGRHRTSRTPALGLRSRRSQAGLIDDDNTQWARPCSFGSPCDRRQRALLSLH
jgi:hypothetical protein